MSNPDPAKQEDPISPVSSEGAGTLFACIPEGRGGTYAFGEESYKLGNAIAYVEGACNIGTMFCTTCVGFYFQVSEGRCFVAHMNAWIDGDHPSNAIDQEGGAEIRSQVLQKLLTEYKRREWDFRDENFADQLIICCPAPESQFDGEYKLDRVHRRTGYYVCEAIGDFMGSLVEEMTEEARLVRLSGAKGSMAKAAELESKAEMLCQRLEHFEILWYHGFVITQKDGEAVIAKVMELAPEDGLQLGMTEAWHFNTEGAKANLMKEKSLERKPAEISSIMAQRAVKDWYGSDRVTQLHQPMQQLHLDPKSAEVRQPLLEKPTSIVMDLSKKKGARSFVEAEPAVHGPSIQVTKRS